MHMLFIDQQMRTASCEAAIRDLAFTIIKPKKIRQKLGKYHAAGVFTPVHLVCTVLPGAQARHQHILTPQTQDRLHNHRGG